MLVAEKYCIDDSSDSLSTKTWRTRNGKAGSASWSSPAAATFWLYLIYVGDGYILYNRDSIPVPVAAVGFPGVRMAERRGAPHPERRNYAHPQLYLSGIDNLNSCPICVWLLSLKKKQCFGSGSISFFISFHLTLFYTFGLQWEHCLNLLIKSYL